MISEHAVVKSPITSDNVRIAEFAVIERDVHIGSDVIIHAHAVINSGATIGDGVEIFPGAYIGREPKGAGATSRKIDFRPFVRVGKNSSIGPHAVIYYDVEIGENTLIGDGASIREQCRIGSRCIVSRYVTINYNTTVGDRSKIMDLTHITGNCTIGNDVFISLLVGSVNDNAIGKLDYEESRVQGATIEDFAAVGAGATLLPNIVIGKHAIVAAGSVVTKNVDPGTLVLGAPAKVARTV